MTKRSGLFAPGAKLVVKEDNKTYTETVTRGNYTVGRGTADHIIARKWNLLFGGDK